MSDPLGLYSIQKKPVVNKDPLSLYSGPDIQSDQEEQQRQGFFNSLYQRVKNLPWVVTAKAQDLIDQQQTNPTVLGGMIQGLVEPFALVGKGVSKVAPGQKEYYDRTLANLKQADTNYQSGADMAMNDLKNIFGRIKDSWNNFISDTVKPVDPNAEQDNFFTAIGKGLISAFTAPVDALIGVDMTKPFNPAFTPEEEAAKIKEGIAVGISTILAPAAGSLVGGASPALKGLAEGAVGGVSFGATNAANSDDQVNQMFQGLVMAPLGAAFEMANKHFETKKLNKTSPNIEEPSIVTNEIDNGVQSRAATLANTKQLMYDENKSTLDLINDAANSANSNTLDEALVKSQISNNPDMPFIINGNLSEEAINAIGKGKIISSINPANQVHLVLPDFFELEKTSESIFKHTGFLPEQEVLVNGKSYEFGNIAPGGKAYVIDNTDHAFLVNLADVQHPVTFNMARLTDKVGPNIPVTPVDLYNAYKDYAVSNSTKESLVPQTANTAAGFKLPTSLSKSSPNYGYGNSLFQVGFKTDFDKAAYIVAGAGKSKSHQAFENALTAQGFDINEVIQHGMKLRADLKLKAKALRAQGQFRGGIETGLDFTPKTTGKVKYDVVITNKPFEEVVTKFMSKAGFDPKSYDAVANTIMSGIKGEAVADMTPVELADYHTAVNYKTETLASSLADQIQASGLGVDYNGSGGITLRDNTGKIVTNVGSSEELSEFLNQSGGSTGVKLDSNLPLPAEISGLNLMSDPKAKLIDAIATGWQKGYAGIISSNPVFADRASFFNALDTRWGINSIGIFEKLQRRRIETAALAKPLKLKMDNIAKSLGNLNTTRLKTLYQSLETASIPELESHSTSMEVTLAKQIEGKDAKPSANFVNQRNRILADQTLDDAGKEQAIKTLTAALNPDKSIVDLIDKIVTMPVSDARLDNVLRLSRAYNNPTAALSRTEFMQKFNFTKAEVAAHEGMVDVLNKAADIFGIEKDDRIFNYITHKKLYDPAISSPTLFEYATDTGKFNSDLMRSGLLVNMDENPFHVIGSYLDEGFNNRFMQPLVDQSRSLFENELTKNSNHPTLSIPDSARPQMLSQFDEFVNNLRGKSPDANRYTQAANAGILDKLPGFSRLNKINWISEINKAQTYATQAFIPGKGVRDLVTLWFSTTAKLGYQKANEIAAIAKRGLSDGSVKAAVARGEIEEFVAFTFKTVSEDKSAETSLYHKIGQAGIKATLQEPINTAWRYAVRTEAYQKAAKALLNLDINDEKAVAAAYKSIGLDKELPSIQNAFDRYVKAGQNEEATKFFANMQVNDILGSYTLGNNPSRWTTNYGRLAGKYGTWAVHQMQFLGRGMAAGSVKDRIAFAARASANEAALVAVASGLGLNLTSYSAIRGTVFTGSPYMRAAQVLLDAYGGDQDKINLLKSLVPIDKDGKIKSSIVVPGSAGVAEWLDVIQRAMDNEWGTAALMGITGANPVNPNY